MLHDRDLVLGVETPFALHQLDSVDLIVIPPAHAKSDAGGPSPKHGSFGVGFVVLELRLSEGGQDEPLHRIDYDLSRQLHIPVKRVAARTRTKKKSANEGRRLLGGEVPLDTAYEGSTAPDERTELLRVNHQDVKKFHRSCHVAVTAVHLRADANRIGKHASLSDGLSPCCFGGGLDVNEASNTSKQRWFESRLPFELAEPSRFRLLTNLKKRSRYDKTVRSQIEVLASLKSAILRQPIGALAVAED
mmetsp:Transcript_29357/g.89824  ORF Transcript_29357/g.89824 Transcript_29357/m.89824 type:complete len:247 (+) Transcript_29357:398-1138(+)